MYNHKKNYLITIADIFLSKLFFRQKFVQSFTSNKIVYSNLYKCDCKCFPQADGCSLAGWMFYVTLSE